MNAMVIAQPQQPVFTMGDMERVANAIAKGGLFGSKDPFAVLTLCMLAQAEGQHPAVVFRDYHLISGKPAKKAEAMQRDFLAAGGKIEWHALTDDIADATFSHPMGGTARISWDKARVKQAQLGGNAMHTKYPRQMLRSRVISEGVRTVYPGATSGLYVPEEVQDFDAPRATPPTPQPMRARDMQALPDRPSTALPPADAGEPTNASAGAEAGPQTDKEAATRDWARKTLALIDATDDRAGLAELQAKRAAGLAKVRDVLPDLATEIDAAFAVKLAFLNSLDDADAPDSYGEQGDEVMA
jgi:hypothetical protein